MAKLLFVDDELTPDRILNLFDGYLSAEERESLESRKAKTPKSIKLLLDKNPCVHVEYNFIEAINTIESHFDDFSFFIIDRNLYATTQQENVKPEYDVNEVPRLLDVEVVSKCEGDYLFLLLLDKYLKYSNPRLLLDNFYFLTAYPKETLQIEESLEKLYMFFKPDHIIDKSIPDTVADFVVNKINKFEELVIKSEHRAVFDIFSKGHLDPCFENDLLCVLKEINSKDQSVIKKNIALLRQVFEVGVLNKVVDVLRRITDVEEIKKQIPKDYDYQKKYKDYVIGLLEAKEEGNPKIRELLTFLNGTTERKRPFKPFTREHISDSNYSLSNSFWKVSSEIAHGGKSRNKSVGYKPTRYTLPSLVNILLDFLIWFGEFMDKHK